MDMHHMLFANQNLGGRVRSPQPFASKRDRVGFRRRAVRRLANFKVDDRTFITQLLELSLAETPISGWCPLALISINLTEIELRAILDEVSWREFRKFHTPNVNGSPTNDKLSCGKKMSRLCDWGFPMIDHRAGKRRDFFTAMLAMMLPIIQFRAIAVFTSRGDALTTDFARATNKPDLRL